jgi:hypothetical protein
MKSYIFAVLLVAALATPAYAMTHYLVAEWYDNGDQFCRYDNGTVLNVGYRICPLKIDG